ncbi:MAG: hypothetical protein HQ445_03290, partial [Polaromonas sp.]|nr:hypothetical protein [Polaromonas sp.]
MNTDLLLVPRSKLSLPLTPVWLLLGLVLGTALQLQQDSLAADFFYAVLLALGLGGLGLG